VQPANYYPFVVNNPLVEIINQLSLERVLNLFFKLIMMVFYLINPELVWITVVILGNFATV
jgi:hypothetical protein